MAMNHQSAFITFQMVLQVLVDDGAGFDMGLIFLYQSH